MLKIAIAGASGYTGGELLRLLSRHPHVRVVAVTSEKSAGKPVGAIFPNLDGFFDLILQPLVPEDLAEKAEFIFTALPHGTSVEPVSAFIRSGKRVVDLSADFRLKDPSLYREWYGMEHKGKELLDSAVYGLPEIYREKIRGAVLVANPGCYPTAGILAIAPLIKNGLIQNDRIYIDAKSAISGAGRGPALPYHFPEAHEGLEAYKVGVHRHTPEIEQALSDISGGNIKVTFVPHLIPANRGLLCTVYAPLASAVEAGEITRIYKKFYDNEPFIRILDTGRQPNIRDVRGANFCDIGIAVDRRNRCIVVTSAIDNLVKGAAGEAIQNMNIMMGFEETTGLMEPGVFP